MSEGTLHCAAVAKTVWLLTPAGFVQVVSKKSGDPLVAPLVQVSTGVAVAYGPAGKVVQVVTL